MYDLTMYIVYLPYFDDTLKAEIMHHFMQLLQTTSRYCTHMWKHGDSLMQMQYTSTKILTLIPESSPLLSDL